MARLAPVALTLLLAVPATAQDTTKDWLARILDLTTVGLTAPEGATLNRKISVDTIRYEKDRPTVKIAVYMMPVDKIPDAAAHFEKVLGVKPLQDKDTKGFATYFFDCLGDAKCPAPAKDVTVKIARSPWVDGMTQIQVESPGKKP